MPALSSNQIASLLEPYGVATPDWLLEQLSKYLELLLRWNARTNLTAIREPEQIVQRHFGESLFLARHLPLRPGTMLDLGSGAGFPGLPVALAMPQLAVTLAESQSRKSSFLREAVRVLGLRVEVWSDRVEAMPDDRRFDVVTLRAVDNPALALQLARQRSRAGGVVAWLTSGGAGLPQAIRLPGAASTVLELMPVPELFHVEQAI